VIARAEIQRIAASLGVDPQVIDHDYALGCFLHELVRQPEVEKSWLFKGGTSLAKCHFHGYRFSEDLDFTVVSPLTAQHFVDILDLVRHAVQDHIGLRMDMRESLVDVVADDYGKESFEGKISYQGVWMFRGDPRTIRVHITQDELVAFSPIRTSIIHPYSDASEFLRVTLQTYALEEVFVEKLRALSGQRRYAIARDLFDLHFLSDKEVDIEAAVRTFRRKCEAKGLIPENIDIASIRAKRDDFKLNWENNLEYLLPDHLKCPFEDAWENSVSLLERAKASL